MFWKNDCFIILKVKYFWHLTIFANTKSNNFQNFFSSFSLFSSFSSFSSFLFQIFVFFYDCRVRYEFNAFTNKLSKSRVVSIDKRKKNQLIVSKRNWKKTKNNVTNVHRIQHLTKLTFLFYHIEWQNRNSFIIKFFIYVLSNFHVIAFYFDFFV